jgi:selenocysteine lyase/cysteine desulfurase
VTGIVSDTAGISTLLHANGALALWDFAAAAPYVQIEMNLRGEGDAGHLAYKDAVFISPHKFIGGPGTPGVLVVKRHLLTNTVPTVPGGGTVSYVGPVGHTYLTDPAHREEGGTPAIIEAIRAGLVFHLKQAVGAANIEQLEKCFVDRAIAAWSGNPRIAILGNLTAKRLSIVSFVVRHEDRLLHHNFVVALLNDLFGIQARGGCSCAGPYGHRLLGIDLVRSERFHSAINAGSEGIKPGWVRVNFNYFISEAAFDYIVDAVTMIASHGASLLGEYDFEPDSGLWHHRRATRGPSMSLDEISYESGRMQFENRRHSEPVDLARHLASAHELFHDVTTAGDRHAAPTAAPVTRPVTTSDFETLRWFPYATDVAR